MLVDGEVDEVRLVVLGDSYCYDVVVLHEALLGAGEDA